jgi:Protein of unknown function (DUF3181)
MIAFDSDHHDKPGENPMASSSQAIEALAAEIGETVYIDVAKWHLYLSNAHLHTVVAEQLYPMLTNDTLSEESVAKVLQSISVKLGGGKREVPLSDLLPMQCQVSLMDLLEEFQRKM